MSINAVIDISHFSTITSFEDVKAADVVGVIHKATQGADFQDPKYSVRRPQALQAGLLWGAYHFGTGSPSGKAQAQYFLEYAKPEPGVLLALDFEPNTSGGANMSLDQAVEFVEEIFQQTGVYPGLYGGGSMLNGDIGSGTNETLAKCWLWFADYAPEPQNIPPNWPTWTMWQYTGDGAGNEPHGVDGIVGNVDRDQFNGDQAALEKLWSSGSSSVKPPPPPVPPKPQIQFSSTEASPLGRKLQQFLNQFPGPSLPVTGIPDEATSNRLYQVVGISLSGAPAPAKSGRGPFIIFDPACLTDYGKMLETYLNGFEGISLGIDGLPGNDVSTALLNELGSRLPGDPMGSGGPVAPLVPYDETHFSQFAKQLQQSLNAYPGISLTVDGIPGGSTSDATEQVMGSRLEFDPRSQA